MRPTVRSTSRSLLWATYLGALSVLVSGPLVSRIFGPLLAHLLTPPVSPLWNPLLGEGALAIGGALLVMGLAWIVELSAAVAAVGVGGVGSAVLALLTGLTAGPRALWSPWAALPERFVLAGVAGFAAHAAARWASRRRARRAVSPGPTPAAP